MSRVEPVDPRVRLAITQWPPDAPRGSVTTFCLEHGISRETFYAIRRRAAKEGPAAALEPRSRRPNHSPGKLSDDVAAEAVAVRAALEQSGLDHGPISVHEKMRALGLEPVPFHGVAVSHLPRRRRCEGRTTEEATVLVPAIRLSRAERVLAARRDRIRPHRRRQVRHLPAM
jgi:Winged helix-turn helix